MAAIADHIRMDAGTEAVDDHDDYAKALVALGVTIFGMDDDDDQDETMNTEYDEFDAWEQTASTVTRNCAKGETVTTLQKLFLEELNNGGDTNDAAARALKRLAALSEQHEADSVESESGTISNISALLAPVQSSTTEVPPAVAAADACKRQQALLSLQKRFLQEINAGGDDASGAAAIALRRLLKPEVQAAKVCKRQEALIALKKRFLQEINADGDDASGAAASALRRLLKPEVQEGKVCKRQEALLSLQKRFLQEINAGGDDASGAAAIALRRLVKSGC